MKFVELSGSQDGSQWFKQLRECYNKINKPKSRIRKDVAKYG
jgi:hypothetical protein